MQLLDQIKAPSDLRELKEADLSQLCDEIRSFFIDAILEHGGHFSANLGVVELTVALHYLFDFHKDKLVWDVGHQAYIHKLLTGRKDRFNSIRHLHGLSGFPKIEESDYDHFGTGHSSTSISAILGMAEAAYLNKQDRTHIAVIGDGSLSGGMAFEALNNLGRSKANVLVIVNDNKMGIDPSTGALTTHLANLPERGNNFFQNLGLDYSGPIDGHDLLRLLEQLSKLKTQQGPRVLHIKTIKGKGYPEAEEQQTKWHAVKYVKISPVKGNGDPQAVKFQDVFGHTLLELAEKDERVVGITPAMPSGSSMKIMLESMPERVFDVGIAEQHAVTFAAGLALEGKRPFCNIYSSFAQRAYDQIIHDVALQNIPVVFCLDRAGLVGEDGPTHHGVFDLAYLNPIPNMTILAPMDEWELRNMMYWATGHLKGPVVIRYPRGRGVKANFRNEIEAFEPGKARVLSKGNKLAVLSIGSIGNEVQAAISEELKKDIFHLDLRSLKPLDMEMVDQVFQNFETIICIEDGVRKGGLASTIKYLASDHAYTGRIHALGIPDEFVSHGSVQELKAAYGLDAESIENLLKQLLGL